jgi:glycogen debranching enzyme
VGELTLLDGATFFTSAESGDVDAGSRGHGLFHEDMRHLSRWQLRVHCGGLHAVSSTVVDYYSGRVVAIPAGDTERAHFPIIVFRDRFVTSGVHEDVAVTNHGMQPCDLKVELRYAADFADLQELQRGIRRRRRTQVTQDESLVRFSYTRSGLERATEITFGSTPQALRRGSAVFSLTLEPGERWTTCIDIVPIVDGERREPLLRCGGFHRPEHLMPLSLPEWTARAPTLVTDWDQLTHVYRRSLDDLASLRIRPGPSLEWLLPAAGLPWFMTLFGRDTLFAAYQLVPFQPELARGALRMLAHYQAPDDDAFRDAEPGKILHELRRGELARSGRLPHSPYYGSHDATPLWLILLDEYERWTGDAATVIDLEPNARAAIDWLERYGDLDGDGYLEYRTRSRAGLSNQCWKDSDNSIRFADGRFAEPPLAVCELQGYAYDARLRSARLAREVWDDRGLARRLQRDAERLRERFNDDFWDPHRRHFALALDRHKQRVDALTSNTGHLLWSGIVDDERAAAVVERLMASDMYTGWGVRTMSSLDAAYSPVEYHNGTVWPFDTALLAEGMRRYRFREQAAELARVTVEAAARFDYRLPELFAGFARDETDTPVPYPGANRPQAFSAGAPLMLLRTLVGMDVCDGRLTTDSSLPPGVEGVCLRNVLVRGALHTAP